jgi:hypothetical protein
LSPSGFCLYDGYDNASIFSQRSRSIVRNAIENVVGSIGVGVELDEFLGGMGGTNIPVSSTAAAVPARSLTVQLRGGSDGGAKCEMITYERDRLWGSDIAQFLSELLLALLHRTRWQTMVMGPLHALRALMATAPCRQGFLSEKRAEGGGDMLHAIIDAPSMQPWLATLMSSRAGMKNCVWVLVPESIEGADLGLRPNIGVEVGVDAVYLGAGGPVLGGKGGEEIHLRTNQAVRDTSRYIRECASSLDAQVILNTALTTGTV